MSIQTYPQKPKFTSIGSKAEGQGQIKLEKEGPFRLLPVTSSMTISTISPLVHVDNFHAHRHPKKKLKIPRDLGDMTV